MEEQSIRLSYASYQLEDLRISLKFSGLRCPISKIKIFTPSLPSLQDCYKGQMGDLTDKGL